MPCIQHYMNISVRVILCHDLRDILCHDLCDILCHDLRDIVGSTCDSEPVRARE